MDKIIEGILASDNSDQVKSSVVRRVVDASAQPGHTTTAAVNILQTCARILLSRPSPFNRDACQRIYAAWARNSRSGLRRFFNASTLERLLDESGSLWLVQQSLSQLRQYREPGGDGYIDLCDRVAGRAAALVRTHPDFSSVWSLCQLLTVVPECIPADAAPFCAAVVHAVAGFSAPPGARHLREYVTAVPSAIGQLLDHLWRRKVPSDCDSPLNHTLRAIIEIISNNDSSLLPSGGCRQPSIALAAIVQYIPVDVVEDVARSAAMDDSVTPATMVLAVSRMTAWLTWPAARNIDLWVLAFLHALAAQRKFEILIEVCHRMSDQVFDNLHYPVVRDSSFCVLSYMLLSFQHSPDVFHKIVGKIPDLVKHVQSEQTDEAQRFVKQLAELVHCLLQLHPGFPDLYEPLLGTFKDFTPPSGETVHRRLNKSRWAVCERTAAVTATVVSRSETGRTGLVNLGNTCYANSVMQALFMCDSLRKEVLAASVRPHQKLLSQLQRVFAFLTASRRAAYAPVEFLQVSRPSWFSAGCQQDCSEYLKYCLDQLHEQERAAWQSTESRSNDHKSRSNDHKRDRTLTERIFGGRMLNTYTCLSCSHVSSHMETFTDMPLAFPADDGSQLTVQSLLTHYLASERLTGGNRYECARCACLRDATRTPAIVHAPKCLVVSLLRFSFDSATRSRLKVLRDVRYLPELVLPVQLPDGTTRELIYTLTAVIVHAGMSSDAGHYYTHARRSDDTEWFLFNDSRVTRSSYASFSRVTSRFDKDTAYVLFYTQCVDSAVENRAEPALRRELQDAVEKDNRLHLQEEQLAARNRALDREAAGQADATTAYYHWRDDNDRGPPGSCGGGGGFHQGSRLVY